MHADSAMKARHHEVIGIDLPDEPGMGYPENVNFGE
jgi:hypothetical protein